MSRPNPLILIGIIVLLGGGLGWLTYSTGVYFLSEHEGDTAHLLDIVFRMHEGQVPHLDFVTPLGILSFLPFAYLMTAGFSVGKAILFGQLLVAALLAPILFYVAWSRLSSLAAYAFVALTIVLLLAISYGGTGAGTSMSMHYNRWAWGGASAVVLLALLPGGRPRPIVDGVLIGTLLSLLALTKITFCLMLLPGVLFALLLQDRRREFYVVLGTGAVAVMLMAIWLGIDFWTAYASNLLNVSGSEVRPHTGRPFGHIVASPAYLPFTAIGFLSFLFLSRAGQRPQAIALLMLLPGFFFITWQNFGNDPVWLLPVLALVLTYGARSEEIGEDHALRLTVVGTLAAFLVVPWGTSFAMSPLRHANQDITEYEPVLPDTRPEARDIFVRRDRGYSMLAQSFLDDPGDPWDGNSDVIDRPEPNEIDGVIFPRCEFMAGSMNWLILVSEDLQAFGIPEGSQFFTTDILSSFWLYGPYQPLENGAPWYYSDLSGIENADFLVVPKCGFAERVRQIIIQDVIDAEIPAKLFAENERVAVYTIR